VSANAHDQVGRMLALVPYLRAKDGIDIDEVARQFGVTSQQIMKDLNVLWFCGLPNSVSGDLIDIDMDAASEGVVFLSNADYLTRPLRLTPSEAVALIVALRTLRAASADAEREVVDRALAKLEAVAGDAAVTASGVDVQIDPVDPGTKATIEQALRAKRRIHLEYYVPSRDETTEREVDPIRLAVVAGHTYLEGWCYRADDVRLFRLDRIVGIMQTDQPIDLPPDAQPRNLSEGLFRPAPDDPIATVLLEPSAAWVADYYPVETVRPRQRGRVEVTLRYSDEHWLRRLILRLGGAARVLEPTSIAEETKAQALRALDAYGVVERVNGMTGDQPA
jgi:proteasome accessory factor C